MNFKRMFHAWPPTWPARQLDPVVEVVPALGVHDLLGDRAHQQASLYQV